MLPYLVLRAGGYLAYYSIYVTYCAMYRMLTADPAAIAMALYL
jgi:hypothetical protein